MELKDKLDECCARELEDILINEIKAGFLSDDLIMEDCFDYIEDNYEDDCDNLTEQEMLEIIENYRDRLKNGGSEENFLKLDTVFNNLIKKGIVALHYAGCVQSEGFEECYEEAQEMLEDGEDVIGCCFYTSQDLESIFDEAGELLYLSFGSYDDDITAEDIGKIVVDELEKVGFSVEWSGSKEDKIGIKDIKWDKEYRN